MFDISAETLPVVIMVTTNAAGFDSPAYITVQEQIKKFYVQRNKCLNLDEIFLKPLAQKPLTQRARLETLCLRGVYFIDSCHEYSTLP